MMTTTHQRPKTGLGMLTTGALAFASAAGVWFAGAGTALAPQPAHLTTPLSGGNGAVAEAYWLNTSTNTTTPTTVVKASTSWTSIYPSPAAGTPCSPTDLAAGQETTRVIVAYNNLRKCQ